VYLKRGKYDETYENRLPEVHSMTEEQPKEFSARGGSKIKARNK